MNRGKERLLLRLPPARLRGAGFTLIELSIVLVVIGLIVGGVLVGQDLIRAAAVRATITQIEKYNQAVNTFRGKYGYLPGDIKDPDASNFGFQARGQYAGEGDGNGIIEGIYSNAANQNNGYYPGPGGEVAVFWVDLSFAHLIDGSFKTAAPAVADNGNSYFPAASTTYPITIDSFFPAPKLGQGNYIYVWSKTGSNYFGLSAITNMGNGIASGPGLTVAQAYAIDKKMDDGLPQSGNVTANYITNIDFQNPAWSVAPSGSVFGATYTTATSGSSTTCYDNGNMAGATQQYSVEISNGANVNCALSFKFQ